MLSLEQITSILTGALDKDLPGIKAQMRMAPAVRRMPAHDGPKRTAAVLLLIYPVDGEPGICLIKRNEYDGPHSGQVGFPGGMTEKSDLGPIDTAIREASEETGIPGEKVRIFGLLTALEIPVSNFVVQPVVGILSETPVFIPDHSEVQYIIQVKLADLLDSSSRINETWKFDGTEINVPFFRAGEHKIWGATAMMLSELLAIIEEAGQGLSSPRY